MDIQNVIKEALIKSGVKSPKIGKDAKNPKFRVTEGFLTLTGSVSNGQYSMAIKDTKGNVVDSTSTKVSNGHDMVNRISESINTLNKLSAIYDKTEKLREDQDFEDIDTETESMSVADTLQVVYDELCDIAEKAQDIIVDVADEDVEYASDITGIVASIYDTALDVDDMITEITGEDEEDTTNESVSRKDSTMNYVMCNLNEAEMYLRKSPNKNRYKDIAKAIKDIRAELTVRGE